MRIALVHPAGSNWVPGKKDITPTANRMAPLGLVSIAAYLEEKGHTVFVHDCLGPRAPAGVDANVKQILAHFRVFGRLRHRQCDQSGRPADKKYFRRRTHLIHGARPAGAV